MGNGSTTKILGVRCILSLSLVHHIPNVRRNNLSSSILIRDSYELNLKCNKVMLNYLKSFIGKVVFLMVCLKFM